MRDIFLFLRFFFCVVSSKEEKKKGRKKEEGRKKKKRRKMGEKKGRKLTQFINEWPKKKEGKRFVNS